MSLNRIALIRYHALDKCFSNYKRRYYFKDIEAAVKEALEDYSTKEKKVSKRQIYNDIQFMESVAGFEVPLERHRDGSKVYYRYATPNFSIRNLGLTEFELEQIRDAVTIIKRLKGFPKMEWTEELALKLDNLTSKKNEAPFIGYQENPYLKGLDLFNPLYQAIQNQTVLEMTYQSFSQSEPVNYIFHPYFLKEYNSRWFVLGKSEGFQELSLFGLDRIISIKEITKPYEPTQVDFEDHFDDVIGVSVKKDDPIEKVKLLVHEEAWPYIETKPFHGSQKRWRVGDEENFTGIQLEVQINYELIANILYRGSAIKVIAPDSLVEVMKKETQKMREYYI